MKNKKILIGVAIVVVIIAICIISSMVIAKNTHYRQEIAKYDSNVLYCLLMYDKNIEIGDSDLDKDGNYYILTITAGNNYTENTYGEEVVKITINSSSNKFKNVYGNNSALNKYLESKFEENGYME